MTKKSKEEKPSAIVKRFDSHDAVAIQPTLNGCLTQLALILSQETLAADTLAAVMSVIRQTKDALEDGLEKQAKVRLIEVLKQVGKKKTDKGSLEATVGDWHLEMSPYRTGADPKKLEARLRAKGIDPAKWMTQTISYAINPDKVQQLTDKRVLSSDELEDCRYNESWTVKTPKKL